MEFLVLKDSKEVAVKAADIIEEIMRSKNEKGEEIYLGLATGSSPLKLYEELIRRHREEGLDFSNVTTVNLDEYVGLSESHSQSYRYYMRENLFNEIEIPINKVYLPKGNADNPEEEARRYEKLVDELPVRDIQILGIGVNGHIAFNEPENPLSSVTHVVNLTKETVEANSRFFNNVDEVPKTAITMGLKQIFRSKHIVLIATGNTKSEVVSKFMDNYITTDNPSSFLKLHPKVTIITDEKAGKGLKVND